MSEVFDLFKIPPELSLMRYLDDNSSSHHFGVIDRKTGFKGFGGDPDILVAQTKALFELVERTVFKTIADGETSSGWAAHSKSEEAKESAKLELIERDAILCSWLLRKSPKIIKKVYFKTFNQEFEILQFGSGENFFVLGVVVEISDSRMLLSTCAASIQVGIVKLLVDSERAFDLLTTPNSISDPKLLMHHNNFCDLAPADLQWLYKDGQGISYSELSFDFRVFKVPLWNGDVAWVVKAKSLDLQKLFYMNKLSDLNLERLKVLSGSIDIKLNESLHPIL